MVGDLQDDWVTTSPLKVAHPPSKRAFTPGRVLSRDEIRQQRRRGHGWVMNATWAHLGSIWTCTENLISFDHLPLVSTAVSAIPPAAVLPTGLFDPPSVNNAGKQDNNDAKDREDRENKQTVNKVQSTYSTTNENSGNSLHAGEPDIHASDSSESVSISPKVRPSSASYRCYLMDSCDR